MKVKSFQFYTGRWDSDMTTAPACHSRDGELDSAIGEWLAKHPGITIVDRQLSTTCVDPGQSQFTVSITVLIWYKD